VNEDMLGLLALLAGDQPPPRGMRPMMQDATRVAPRRGEVQQQHTISAYAPNDRGGLMEKVRGLLGMSNLPQEPGLLGRVASFVGLNDPLSMVEGPAMAMGMVARPKIAGAALRRADGKVFPGSNHGLILDDYPELRRIGARNLERGFVDVDGNFWDEREIHRLLAPDVEGTMTIHTLRRRGLTAE
jgi:hypothetical protein